MAKSIQKDKSLISEATTEIKIEDKKPYDLMVQRREIVENANKIADEIKKLEQEKNKLAHKANKFQAKLIEWCKKNIELEDYHELGDIKIKDDYLIVDDIDLVKLWKLSYKKKQ